MCAFVVLGFVFPYQAKRLAWETSLKWPILCRVGRKAATQSVFADSPNLGKFQNSTVVKWKLKQLVGTSPHIDEWRLLSDPKIAHGWLSVHVFVVMCWFDVLCRIYHTVVLDDPYDDPPGLESHIPDQSPQLTREQLDVSSFSTPCISCLSAWVPFSFYYRTTHSIDVQNAEWI